MDCPFNDTTKLVAQVKNIAKSRVKKCTTAGVLKQSAIQQKAFLNRVVYRFHFGKIRPRDAKNLLFQILP